MNYFLLTNPGIGRQSPTMARRREQRKISKEQLAMAVRKDFNNAAVNEVNVAVDLLYKIRHQGQSHTTRYWRALADVGGRQGVSNEITPVERQAITPDGGCRVLRIASVGYQYG